MKKKLFITMAGNIGCGKTTAAKLLSQHFGFELFDEPVIDNRFLREYYSDMKRWSLTLQMEFLIRRVEHHELIFTVPKSCVQDRSLYEDPEIFAKYLHGLGHMTDNELNLYFTDSLSIACSRLAHDDIASPIIINTAVHNISFFILTLLEFTLLYAACGNKNVSLM